MKTILTIALLFASLFTFSQSSHDSLNRPGGLNPKYAAWYVAINGEFNELHVQKKNSNRKRKIKKGAIAFIKTKNDTLETLCKLLVFNDSGLYISPYRHKVLTETDNGSEYNVELTVLDTIQFINYKTIQSFRYKNNFEGKAWRNQMLFSTGISLLITPPVITGLNNDRQFFSKPEDGIIMGIGALITWYSIYKFKKNAKLKFVDLNDYYFKYVHY